MRMHRRIWTYASVAVLTWFSVMAAVSLRDIEAYKIENGIGFYPSYEPSTTLDLAKELLIFLACGAVTVWRLRNDAVLPVFYALAVGALFFGLHTDPFYRDWEEDTFFDGLAYTLAGVTGFLIKDGILYLVGRLRPASQFPPPPKQSDSGPAEHGAP